jgi:predicted site-specific integrase-resolvase
MENIIVANENDLKRWIKEALREYFEEENSRRIIATESESTDLLVSRKVIAGLLGISLVTLHAWMKKGLPAHKNGGRVYFVKNEVLEFITRNGRRN